MDRLRLEVIMSAVDRVTGPLRRVVSGSSATSRALKTLRDNYKQLEAQQGLIKNFRNAHKASATLTGELAAQRAKVRALAAEHAAAGNVTAAMSRQMAQAQARARELKDRFAQQQAALQGLRDRMGQAGMSTTGLAAKERSLRADMERTTAAMAAQKTRLQALTDARQRAGRMAARGAGMAAAGMGSYYATSRAAHAATGLMGQSRTAAGEAIRIRALGLEGEDAGKAIDYARNFKSYGTSTTDNMALMRDAVTVFNDFDHAKDALPFLAKMKFANEAAFGGEHAADNERKFMDMLKVIEMRNGANNREDFERNGNLVQQVLTATGGRVGAEDWLNLIKTGGVAAKGISEKEFFYRLEPLVQEMGGDRVGTGMMSAYQNLYQGRTTKRAANMLDTLGLIADPSKVKHDKVGQIAQLGVGALKGSDVFQRSQFEWLETVLVPALNAKGIKSEKEVLDAIGGIFSNRNAAGLFATMFQQRSMINKSYALNERAANVDTLHGMVKEGPRGKEIDLEKRRDDLYLRMGEAALPLYVQLLEKVTAVTEAVSNFAQAHPGLTKAVMYTGAAFLGMGAVLTALLIPLGLLLAKGALVRFLFARMFGGATAAAVGGRLLARIWSMMTGAMARMAPWVSAVGRGLAWVAGIIRTALVWAAGAAGRALLWIGQAALIVGRFLLTSPLGIAISLIAGAAYLIWRNWDWLKTNFLAICDVLADAGRQWWRGIEEGYEALVQKIGGWKDHLFTAGGNLVDGLVDGVRAKVAMVKEVMGGMAESVKLWFTEPMQIQSPSRVFMRYGEHISEGAALGIERGQALARVAAVGLAGITMAPMGAAASAPMAMASGSAPAAAGGPISITINAAPGQDAQAIARAVSAELDRRERDRASRRYSQLADID
ncbi:hypothetical protein [Delftia tsuruhatensis]|uniref:hypothetical protein n=1 Tax=Delftia tsuruhatensis TaxID=180282 RepID=UPI002090EE00|nr:hypothetical protein [Delftia tsuruhatensis]MCO5339252.1 hypothetical protein [Delftia tsuruhatensis]MCR4546867.1 hypothetical protein [Delftia tsuruhatensis]